MFEMFYSICLLNVMFQNWQTERESCDVAVSLAFLSSVYSNKSFSLGITEMLNIFRY